jgi:hypothetical protein
MTGDEAKLERQLREATGRSADRGTGNVVARSPDQDIADPETAALAEGWQALSQLLAAAEADFRPDVVLQELRRRRFRERMWRGGALLAAAVLLIGVGFIWYVNHGAELIARPNQPRAPAPAGRLPSGIAKSSDAAVPKTNDALPSPSSVANAAATPSGWDQTLDQQISEADESVQNAKTLGNASDDLIDQLDKQLVSFRQEVEANSL